MIKKTKQNKKNAEAHDVEAHTSRVESKQDLEL